MTNIFQYAGKRVARIGRAIKIAWLGLEACEAARRRREQMMFELLDSLLQNLQGLILSFQAVASDTSLQRPTRERLDIALEMAERLLVESRTRIQEVRDV